MKPPARVSALGANAAVVAALLVCMLVAFVGLGLSPADLIPRAGGLRIAKEFAAAAFRPALAYQDAAPTGSVSLLATVALAVTRTLLFAVAAMSIALPAGLVLGVLASSSFWLTDASTPRDGLRRPLAVSLQWSVRILIALLRSVHEFIWALLFLAAAGLNTAAAVCALALPFSGVLAKVFSEMIDETPRQGALALRAIGASHIQVLVFGLLPRAGTDIAAYTFYRFECAVRSSAVLGFFGFETLGYYIKASFENLHYREVWTYLYALFAVVLLLEAWSGALRRRFVA